MRKRYLGGLPITLLEPTPESSVTRRKCVIFQVDYLDGGNIHAAAVIYTNLSENSVRKFLHMIWIGAISIDLESLIANVEYFRFPSFRMQGSSFFNSMPKHIAKRDLKFFLFWQNDTLWERLNYLHILSRYYQFSGCKIMSNTLSYTTCHFIVLSVNTKNIILYETFLRCSGQTLNVPLDKVVSRSSLPCSMPRVCLPWFIEPG